jgi:cytochrome c oxidase assembly protein subunit 15
MTSTAYNPLRHRFAAATVCVAMLTLIAGALVTSKNAGMAFRDWPTSDGHAMVTYPWLADFARDWDKFLEHGHRLAGMLIGLWSIGLAVLLAWSEPRRWVKLAGVGVLLAVIAQGVLGGSRVWFDERGLAMVHGAFAACVLAFMASVSTFESRAWVEAPERFRAADVSLLKPLALLTIALLALQFVLGGLIRHRGTGLYEHLAFGIAAFLFVILNAVVSHRSGVGWVRRSGWLLLVATTAQVALGGGTWVAKWGFAWTGYVAVADSIQQVALRTAHAVAGMVVFMTAVVHAVRVFRVDSVALECGDSSPHSDLGNDARTPSPHASTRRGTPTVLASAAGGAA